MLNDRRIVENREYYTSQRLPLPFFCRSGNCRLAELRFALSTTDGSFLAQQ
jgi:hypothetical protein